ncbi:penicillin-binding protein 2 [Piscirickettsia litoralis]|uniref:hypothetical protein n=1 Tax=Piscirickettsia litoralis TaxID=1891921 RepID=UPI001F4385A2|nr:hypothetical protein [Piscirickettsia litoralis]
MAGTLKTERLYWPFYNNENNDVMTLRGRFWVLFSLLSCVAIAVAARLIYLQSIDRPFLERAWQTQSTRFINVDAYRGMILDRDGVPLAVSSLVDSIVLDPVTLLKQPKSVAKIAALAPGEVNERELWQILRSHKHLRYWFWQRDLPPFMVKKISLCENYWCLYCAVF